MAKRRGAIAQSCGEFFQTASACGVTGDGGGQNANHLVKEATAFEAEFDFWSIKISFDAMDRANRVLGFLRPARGEGGKIVGAFEKRTRRTDRVGIQLPVNMPCSVGEHRMRHWRAPDRVGVDFSNSRKPRVKIFGHFAEAHDANRWRQVGVESGKPFARGEASAGDIDMGLLGIRVDSGVGASGAVDRGLALAESVERFFQKILHGVSSGLALPSVQSRAVVGDF